MIEAAVFDSNVLIRFSLGDPVAKEVLQDVPRKFISQMSWIEFLTGIEENDIINWKNFLRDHFETIPCDQDVSERVLAVLKVHRLKLPDAVNYATAKFLRLPLVTFDSKDFDKSWPDVYIPE